jgi:hypothetical protein
MLTGSWWFGHHLGKLPADLRDRLPRLARIQLPNVYRGKGPGRLRRLDESRVGLTLPAALLVFVVEFALISYRSTFANALIVNLKLTLPMAIAFAATYWGQKWWLLKRWYPKHVHGSEEGTPRT